jgi:hypothetical protein
MIEGLTKKVSKLSPYLDTFWNFLQTENFRPLWPHCLSGTAVVWLYVETFHFGINWIFWGTLLANPFAQYKIA